MKSFSFLRYWALQFFTVLFLILSCHPPQEPKGPDRIGINPEIDQYERSAITLLNSDDEVNCSGVAISPHQILTAKHCQGFLLYSEILQRMFGISYPDNHAIGRMVSYQTFNDKTIKKGMVQRIDPKNDLTIITTIDPLDSWMEISTTEPKIGDEIINIGNPGGMVGILSRGVVSGLHYMEGSEDPIMIATGLSIIPGSSGSSVLCDNRVVGVVVAYNPKLPSMSYSVGLMAIRRFVYSEN